MNQKRLVILVSMLCRSLYANRISIKYEKTDCKPTAKYILAISSTFRYWGSNWELVSLAEVFLLDEILADDENIICVYTSPLL